MKDITLHAINTYLNENGIPSKVIDRTETNQNEHIHYKEYKKETKEFEIVLLYGSYCYFIWINNKAHIINNKTIQVIDLQNPESLPQLLKTLTWLINTDQT